MVFIIGAKAELVWGYELTNFIYFLGLGRLRRSLGVTDIRGLRYPLFTSPSMTRKEGKPRIRGMAG